MKKLLYILSGLFMGFALGMGISTFAANPITFPINGGTGTNCKPTLGQVLVGTSGGVYNCQATSTLGITGGTNYLTNSGNTTYLNTGNVLAAATLSATSTTATSTIANFETVLYADNFTGSDIGAKVNAAYAALPVRGGRIVVPYATSTDGLWHFSTPIVFGTNNKIAQLYCASGGGASNNANGGVTLEYDPSTGDAITINTNNYASGSSGIENCDIQGTNGTSARTTNGITLGGTNGAFSAFLNHVNLSGFGTGLHLYQNTSFDTVIDSSIHFNGRNIFIESTSGANGENFKMIGGVVADSNNQAGGDTANFCINNQLSGNTQVSFIGTSIDDCQYYSNQSGGTANETNFTDVHWENPNGHTYDYVNTLNPAASVSINFKGGDLMNDVVGGMPEFISGTGNFSFDGTVFDDNNNVTTPVTRVVNAAASSTQIEWQGTSSKGAGVRYIYGSNPISPFGVGSDYGVPSLFVASSTSAGIGNVGISTSTPGSILSVGGVANFTNATSTFYGNGINITAGCFSVAGVCVGAGTGAGTVTSITASSPLTGGTITTTGSIGCQTASGSQAGCLSSADWTTFNGKGTGTVGSGTMGQFPYYAADGTTLSATSTVFLGTNGFIGIGTSSPQNNLEIKGNTVVSSNSSTAFDVGPNGLGNPAFQVNASAANSATGLGVTSNAAGSGLALSTLTSGVNENLTIDAKGSGTVNINNASSNAGLVTLGNSTSGAGVTMFGLTRITSGNANALAVGKNGITNPILQVDASTASVATGIALKGAAAGGGIALTVISSGTNENLIMNAKGTGNLLFNTVSTGILGIGTTSPYASVSIQTGSTTGDAFVIATSSGNAIFGIDNDGHMFTSGPTPVITNGTDVGDDISGTLTTNAAVSSVTLTFAKAYRSTPTCKVTDDSLTISADVSSVSTTAVVFSLSAPITTGHLYYQCSYHK